jgi:hypothetical protein
VSQESFGKLIDKVWRETEGGALQGETNSETETCAEKNHAARDCGNLGNSTTTYEPRRC